MTLKNSTVKKRAQHKAKTRRMLRRKIARCEHEGARPRCPKCEPWRKRLAAIGAA